jgi:hypothetical protein
MKAKVCVAASVIVSVFLFPMAAHAAVTFAPAVSYPVGNAHHVAIGDLNGDGKPDLTTADFGSNYVSVLLGNGDGTFAAAVSYSVGDSPHQVAIGDLNGDGKPDLTTADLGSDNVSVLLGNGDGTFAAAVSYSVGDAPHQVVIGDLDGDGKSDLSVANRLSADVSVLLGNGDGTFAAAVSYPAGADPVSVAIGDLDGDGAPDLTTANFVNAGTVSVLLGNGDGSFAAAVPYSVGDLPHWVAIGDLNGDGAPDLTTADLNSNNVSVLLGNGDGTFAAAVSYPVGAAPHQVAIGDLNGDGRPDLATANLSSNNVSVLLGEGDGTFAAAVSYSVGDLPHGVAIGDLNGDGRPDLATSNRGSNNVSVLLNSTVFPFATGPTATISGTVRQGQTLTADEGSPDPTPDSFTYEWLADGVAIGGATAKTFQLTSAQVGKKISVTVTASKTGFTDASDTSPETAAVIGIFTPGPTATISGYARVGSTLTANAGSPSPTPTTLGYRWFADGVQLAPVTKTLKLTSAMHGKRIQVRVYAIKSGYLTATSLSPVTASVSSLQAKTISLELNDYTVKRGQRIYANLDELASHEPWSIVLDGKTLISGYADAVGFAKTSFIVPANAIVGIRTIYGYGKFPDRRDADRITIR